MRSTRTWVGALRRAGRLARSAAHWPGVADLRRAACRSEFLQGRPLNGCWGVYSSFDEAERSIERGQPVGYDHAQMAAYYRDMLERPRPDDYPALFWLRPALEGANRLFDWGGHVGVSYYGCRRHLGLSGALEWLVCDVPAVVRDGEALAKERGAAALRFTTRPDDADGADVLLAAGSLQYLPSGSLQALLGRLAAPPEHVIVNRTPLHPTRAFVTVQATGHAFCPYAVGHWTALVEDLKALGYALVDDWQIERRLEVPFAPWTRIDHYSGLYFRR